jgi:hypothetical protein
VNYTYMSCCVSKPGPCALKIRKLSSDLKKCGQNNVNCQNQLTTCQNQLTTCQNQLTTCQNEVTTLNNTIAAQIACLTRVECYVNAIANLKCLFTALIAGFNYLSPISIAQLFSGTAPVCDGLTVSYDISIYSLTTSPPTFVSTTTNVTASTPIPVGSGYSVAIVTAHFDLPATSSCPLFHNDIVLEAVFHVT